MCTVTASRWGNRSTGQLGILLKITAIGNKGTIWIHHFHVQNIWNGSCHPLSLTRHFPQLLQFLTAVPLTCETPDWKSWCPLALTVKLLGSPIIYFFNRPLGNGSVSISTFSASHQAHTFMHWPQPWNPIHSPGLSCLGTNAHAPAEQIWWDPEYIVLLVLHILQVGRIYSNVSKCIKSLKSIPISLSQQL